MLKANTNKIKAGTTPNFSDDSIRIQAGSFVIDNKWINFNGTLFRVTDYITSVLVGGRTRFFKDRNYAVYLLIGIDPVQGIKVTEGRHVLFTTLQAVPPPDSYDYLPLIGVILIQNGTRDLNFGYLPLKNENITFLSGYGNVIDKNLTGDAGDDSTVYGETGFIGVTGLDGYIGFTGFYGASGYAGPTAPPPQGVTGMGGMTGINWDIHIPFQEFF